MKVIFCNIAYMKYYRGIADDIPRNGGKYIKENNTGGEIFNFLDYNGSCHGYFMSYGQTHIERLEGVDQRDEETDDVLVVWTAKKDASSSPVIVGWYKHATVYRHTQYTRSYDIGLNLDYDIIAESKNCYLLPEENRRFTIPRAPVAGPGKGMGQSAIWYAESAYAQSEFIPKVVEYIENYEKDCDKFINIVYSEEEVNKKYNGTMSTDELIALAENTETPAEEALLYANTVLERVENGKTLFLKADILSELFQFSLAQNYYEKAFEADNSLLQIQPMLHNIYMITGQYDKAAVTGKMIENSELFAKMTDTDKWSLWGYTGEALIRINKPSAAGKYIEKLKTLNKDELDGLDKYIEYWESRLDY